MDKFVSTKQKQQKILDENITNKQKNSQNRIRRQFF